MSSGLLGPVPATHEGLFTVLDEAVAAGTLRALDRHFAAFLALKAPDAPPLLLIAATLASQQLGRGHACVDLAQLQAVPPEDLQVFQPWMQHCSGADWAAALQHPVLVGQGPGATPLVQEGTRLYLRRYWQHEQTVRAAIDARLAPLPGLDDAALGQALRQLFPQRDEGSRWQRIACALAARQRFAIVTGGPGTGKTTTVVRLLAVLQQQALATSARPLRIRLAAPTGKAAARLSESIARAVDALPLATLGDAAALRAAISTQVSTVHRLLGSRPDTRRFRHHAGQPLPLDALVIDEASMLDLETMAALCEALPSHARLLLLGDKDQLASVQAGSVLGDLCARADAGHYTPATVAWLQRTSGDTLEPELQHADGRPLDQAIVKLRHSHRFDASSGIGRLAAAVNQGDPAAVQQVWQQQPADLAVLPAGDLQALRRLVLHGQGAAPAHGDTLRWLRAHRPPLHAPSESFDAWAAAALAALSRFQLLAALREGPFGVDGLNRQVGQWLHEAGLLEADPGGWVLGRAVLVTGNDYALGLMNGDVGLTLAQPSPDRSRYLLRVAFPRGDGQPGVRWLLPGRLRHVETAFAITVHKSQGSEFEHAALVLPDRLNPVLTRELVYTGITRAKRWFTLVPGAAGVLESAVQRRVQRMGGLIGGDPCR